MSDGTRIVTVEPTVLLSAGADGQTRQCCRVTVENNGDPGTATVVVSGSEGEESFPLGLLPRGPSEHAVHPREAARPERTRFTLLSPTGRHTTEVPRDRVRRWTCHVVHGSHHDLGYTDLPSRVLREHADHLDQVVEWCDETADWPPDSRFAWVAEQAWSVLYHLENRGPERARRLLEHLGSGRVEVTGLFANQTTELCGHEELIRALYPSAALSRRHGIPIRTAELNDIPGVSWGLVTALADAGIRYFVPGIQDYFGWGRVVRAHWDEAKVLPRDLLGAFRWQGPDGRSVLVWYGGRLIETLELWSYEHALRAIPAYLERLQSAGYPWEHARIKVHSGRRDNSPPDLRFSRLIRDWNERWVSPRLTLTTNAAFFAAFEPAAGELDVLRGELVGTDYPLGATSMARELAANRRSHDMHASAEALALWAAAETEQAWPADPLAESRECVLLGDEHTMGMAHPIGPANEASCAWKAEKVWRGAALCHDVLTRSANRLADDVELDAEGWHIVVFNTLDWPRTDVVRLDAAPAEPAGTHMYWTNGILTALRLGGRNLAVLPADLLEGGLGLVDVGTGETHPAQVRRMADPLELTAWAGERWTLGLTEPYSPQALGATRAHHYEIVFVARDVPALGYRTYRVVRGDAAAPGASARATRRVLESPAYRVEVDPARGGVTALVDRETGRQWVDTTAGMGPGCVLTRASGTLDTAVAELAPWGEVVSGPVFATLASRGALPGLPGIRREITVWATLRRVDFTFGILADGTPLREVHIAFPFALDNPTFDYDATLSVIRPGRDQLPGTTTAAYAAQHWVRVADPEGELCWCSPDVPVVQLGGLWPSPVSQAHHAVSPPGWQGPVSAWPPGPLTGHIHSFVMNNNYRTNFRPTQVADLCARYSITTGVAGGVARPDRMGRGLSAPLEAVAALGPRQGRLPPVGAFLTVDGDAQLVALKAAEDGDGIIVRLREARGEAAVAGVRFARLDVHSACRTSAVEVDGESVTHTRDGFHVSLPPYGIATVRVRDGRRYPVPGRLTWLA